MDLFVFDELDSTSTTASEMLQRGQKTPFAVQALAQRIGRGRRGRTWESPPGNLYLTLVCPAFTESHCSWCSQMGPRLSALRAAWVIAQIIKKEASLQITIKWPNDLYIYGSKIGGILVESSMSRHGERVIWGPHVIGIGLNLKSLPQGFMGADRLESYSPMVDPVFWGQVIARDFLKLWEQEPSCQLVDAMDPFLIAPGHPWCEGSSEPLGENTPESSQRLFFQMPLQRDGTLRLTEASPNGQSLELNSAHHHMRWLYSNDQGAKATKEAPLVIADIGNSRVKIALFQDVDLVEPMRVVSTENIGSQDFIHQMRELRDSLGAKDIQWPLHVLSVNPNGTNLLFELCKTLGWMPMCIKKRTTLLHQRMGNESYPFSQLGIDRIAAMEGFLASLSPAVRAENRIGVILSLGTASTIDFVTTTGTHLGGVILPGIELSLRALHQETGLLPLVKPEVQLLGLGQNTETAMAHGVMAMTLGAVKILREKLGDHLAEYQDQSGDIGVITGGLAGVLKHHAPRYEVWPHLVLRGGKFMVLSGG